MAKTDPRSGHGHPVALNWQTPVHWSTSKNLLCCHDFGRDGGDGFSLFFWWADCRSSSLYGQSGIYELKVRRKPIQIKFEYDYASYLSIGERVKQDESKNLKDWLS